MAALQGHRGRGVWRCALLPGGRAATAGADGSLKLWPLANFGAEPARMGNQPQQAPCEPGGRLRMEGASADFEGSEQNDVPLGGGGPQAGRAALQVPPGVEALALDYAHLAVSAAAAEAERSASDNPQTHTGSESGSRVSAPSAGHAGGSSVPAQALHGGESAGTSGQAVFFRRADSTAALEWVRCLGFAGNPGSPGPGLLYVATQRGLLHRVRLPQGSGSRERARWQRVWACPLEGHPMCMAVRVSTPDTLQDGQAVNAGCDATRADGPAPGAPVNRGASGPALQGCGGGGAGADSAPDAAAEPARSCTGPACRRAQACGAWDSVLLGGFAGWAACVWVPAASDAERASVSAPCYSNQNSAARDTCTPVPAAATSLRHRADAAADNAVECIAAFSPEPSSLRHDAAATAAACAAGAQAGQVSPSGSSAPGAQAACQQAHPGNPEGAAEPRAGRDARDGSGVPGTKAVCWQAHPGSAVHRTLWAPELGPRYAATTNSLGALCIWRLPEPPPCLCSQGTSNERTAGLSGPAAVPCACPCESCADPEKPSPGPQAGAAGPQAGVEMQGTGSCPGSGAGSAAGAPQLWAEARSPYGEPLTCMAAAPTRRVLVAGDALGSILVFHLLSGGDPVLSLRQKFCCCLVCCVRGTTWHACWLGQLPSHDDRASILITTASGCLFCLQKPGILWLHALSCACLRNLSVHAMNHCLKFLKRQKNA